jgi:hypothetical protein
MAGEAKNPKRDVSRAVITAMLVAQLSTWHSRSRSSDRSTRGTLRTAWTKAVLKPLLREQWKNLEAIDACTDLDYDRYGFRVSAVIVCPYAKPGHVYSTVYDHTSILKLIEEKWNLPSLTRRDADAKSPMASLDLRHAHFAQPPTLAGSALPWTATDTPAPTRSRQDGSTS